jgi:DNA polymerase-3 subunit epsilon
LHKLTESLGLPDFNHHRALDDTLAAAAILKSALEKVGEAGVMKNVVNISVAKKQAFSK